MQFTASRVITDYEKHKPNKCIQFYSTRNNQEFPLLLRYIFIFGSRLRSFIIDDTVLKDMVETDSWLTVHEIGIRLEVNHSTVVRHLKKLGKIKKLDKWETHFGISQ